MAQDPILSTTPEPFARPPHRPRREQDLALAQLVVAGDAGAWGRFVERYAGLLYSVIRRYLHPADRDDVRTVFADVLVSLRRSKLRTYEGRAALSTWLTLVARTEALDHLRHRFGRGREARLVARLSHAERKLFRLYHVEGWPAPEVVRALARDGEAWTLDRFVAALRRIEARLGDAWLRRLAYDLHAQSVGAASGRLLEYLDHVRDEFAQRAGAHSPEYHLMEREARRTSEQLTETIASLPPRERELLRLRFERGWTAGRIARELGLPGARGVYSATDRILRRLRRLLGGGEEG